MSVLITGMELPKSCEECRCAVDRFDGSTGCCLGASDIDWNKRPSDCPLKPVDEPEEDTEEDDYDEDKCATCPWLDMAFDED